MTKKLGILGWPARHSLSPRIYRYWFRKHAIEATYDILETPEDALATEIEILRKSGFHGANITVPHKEKALALVDEADNIAQRIGAINTVLVRESGKIFGTNTDAYGFMENLRQGTRDFSTYLDKAVVLGAGGAARAIIASLSDAGAKGVYIVNRTPSRAHEIAKQWPNVSVGSWENVDESLKDATLLVNTTSLGMEGMAPLALSLKELPSRALVTDIVYAPMVTPLLKEAQRRGNPTVDGLGMLLYQAQAAFRLWFGVTPEVTKELREHIVQR
jgi:shikimate dehydrogenase